MFIIFLIGGFVFPVFMSTLQSLTTTARGTVSALSNAAMYGGTTLGGAIGGLLFAHYMGFMGVSFFTVIMYIVSLFIYTSTGMFRSQNKHNTQPIQQKVQESKRHLTHCKMGLPKESEFINADEIEHPLV